MLNIGLSLYQLASLQKNTKIWYKIMGYWQEYQIVQVNPFDMEIVLIDSFDVKTVVDIDYHNNTHLKLQH